MKVYILTATDWESHHICGVYKTREAAELALVRMAEAGTRMTPNGDLLNIEEHTLEE